MNASPVGAGTEPALLPKDHRREGSSSSSPSGPRPSGALFVSLPLPPRACYPNARVDWHVKANAVASYREAIMWIGRALRSGRSGFPLPAPVRAELVFIVKTERRRDFDNLHASLKAAWDGLVDAGVLVDDNAKVFWSSVVGVEIRPAQPSHVVVKLYERTA